MGIIKYNEKIIVRDCHTAVYLLREYRKLL